MRAISKVAEAYKRDRRIQPAFRPHGALVCDQRVLSWKGPDRVSILTLHGRERIPVVMTGYQQALLDRIRGQADLNYRNGQFFLAVVVDVPEPPPIQPTDWLGGDLGLINIAADSDRTVYSGQHLKALRARHARLRQRLQKTGTKSAKRLLKKRRRKEARFATDVNHRIAKQLVTQAQGTRRGIALEDLTGIRDRMTVSKAQRRRQHSWAFHQLRRFIEYKARLAGVPVTLVDPRNTSRTCPQCGLIDKHNRPDQAHFRCIGCGFARPADTTAARNIASRAAVNQPQAAGGSA
ncbi:MAG: transposase [Firmicutes bacterium]|nr:transposase [Bacillota bacterium]